MQKQALKHVLPGIAVLLTLSACSDMSTAPSLDQSVSPFFKLSYNLSEGPASAVVKSKALDDDKVLAVDGIFSQALADWANGPGKIKGELVHVGRGCPDAPAPPDGVPGGDTYLADPAGKIALIERGACYFSSKVARARDAGAIGVIVYNIEGGDFRIIMAGAEEVDLPAVFVTRSVGEQLRDGAPVKVEITGASFKVLEKTLDALKKDKTLTKEQEKAWTDLVKDAKKAVKKENFQEAVDLLAEFQSQLLLACDPIPDDEGNPIACNSGLPLDDIAGLYDSADLIIMTLTALIEPVMT